MLCWYFRKTTKPTLRVVKSHDLRTCYRSLLGPDVRVGKGADADQRPDKDVGRGSFEDRTRLQRSKLSRVRRRFVAFSK